MPPERRVIFEEEQRQIESILRDFLKNSEAKGVLVVDMSGALINGQGFLQRFDTEALGVLAAGTVASTRQMARIVGEPVFTDLFHQGKRSHLYLSLIGDEAVLVVIFDNTTTLGLVRLYSQQAVKSLKQIYAKLSSREAQPLKVEPSKGGELPESIFKEKENKDKQNPGE